MLGHSAEYLGRRSNEGSHLIKHWSSTQKAVTLSSAEAELCGIVKGSTEALGIQSVGRDLSLSKTLSTHTDSAAVGIGRVRHLVVGQLWVQGDANLANALTKHLSREVLGSHVAALSQKRLAGRAVSALMAQL